MFSLGNAQLEELLGRAGFEDVVVTASEKLLRLPAPLDFLWQYVTSTPLGVGFAGLDETARRDFARDVVGGWHPFVQGDSLVLDLRLLLASAVAP